MDELISTTAQQEKSHVTAQYLKRTAALAAKIKATAHKAMAIQPGDRVLDVGCGPGVDTVPLAKLVGSAGQVIGIDTDAQMLQHADSFADEQSVSATITHQLGSATELPFESASFNSSHAERLLQVLPSIVRPAAVLAEMQRVTKPGGSVVVVDADWGSLSINSTMPALERKLVQFFAEELRPNGFAGRQLLGLFAHAQLKNIDVQLFPLLHTNLENIPLAWLYKEAVQRELAPKIELDAWWQELNDLSKRNALYCTVNMVLVSGQV